MLFSNAQKNLFDAHLMMGTFSKLGLVGHLMRIEKFCLRI
jgi:hypothetical protein